MEVNYRVVRTGKPLHQCGPFTEANPQRGEIVECAGCKAWWEYRTASYWKMDPFEKFFVRLAIVFVNKGKLTYK